MSQAFTDQLKQVVSEFETLGYNHTKKAAEQVRIVCDLHNWSKNNLQTLHKYSVIWRAWCSLHKEKALMAKLDKLLEQHFDN
jgi:hypothetical protein